MAKIYGRSGSTRCLLKGLKPINGKKFSTLDEISSFHNNYEDVLRENEIVARTQYEEILHTLSNEEIRLDKHIMEEIARRTKEVDANITDLFNKTEASEDFLPTLSFLFQYLVAFILRSHRIHSPLSTKVRELRKTRNKKAKAIADKPHRLQIERKNIVDSQIFLNESIPFLIGAYGEELVINILSVLPDGYYILNDINITFENSIYWKKYRESIKTCQIDHIVIGPTGAFLLETKNWKRSNLEDKTYFFIHQVKRANFALRYFLRKYYKKNEMPEIRNVVVSIYGIPFSQNPDPHLDVVTPDLLIKYISERPACLTEDAIYKMVRLIPRPEEN